MTEAAAPCSAASEVPHPGLRSRTSLPREQTAPVDVAPFAVVSPPYVMRRVSAVLAVLLAAPAAGAQLVPLAFVSRAGSPRGAAAFSARINRVDCAADEVITVTASLPTPPLPGWPSSG